MVFHVVLFCRACPLSPPPPSPLASSSFILLHPISLPSFLSFSREINTHGWAGRATGEPRRWTQRKGTSSDGQKIAEREILLRLIASSCPLARPYIGNNFDPRSPASIYTYAEVDYVYVHVVLIIHYMTQFYSKLLVNSSPRRYHLD